MAKTKKKEVQKQGLRPSQKAKAEKLRKKQEIKAKVKEEKASQSAPATAMSKADAMSKDTEAIKAQDSISKTTKSTSKSSETTENTVKTAETITSLSENISSTGSSSLKTIHVKNAEGNSKAIINVEKDKLFIEIDKHNIISFDIFDTLLLRPYVNPSDLFRHMEKEYNISGFYEARINAEQNARKNKGTREDITYDEIYTYIDNKFKRFKDKELQWEYNVSLCNEYIKKAYQYAMSQNKRIIITSDIYFSKSFIKKLLDKSGYSGYEKLYISSEIEKTKLSANLYRYILNDLGCKPEEILHIGDNWKSDINSAKNIHIDTYYNEKVITRYFKENIKANICYEKSKSIENSIYLMLLAIKSPKGYKNYWEKLGYEYAGPVLYSYMSWLKEQALKDEIDHLLFIARDGYTPQKIFTILGSENIKTSYIYAPRIFNKLGLLEFDEQNDAHLDEIINFYYKAQGITKSIQKLDTQSSKITFIRKHQKEIKAIADDYFKEYQDYIINQNISEKRVAIVDSLTSNLSSQRLLSKALNRNIAGYYWAITKKGDILAKHQKFKFDTYYKNKFTFGKDLIYWDFMEFLMTAPENPIQEIKNNKVIYKSNISEAEKFRKQVYPDVSNGSLLFAQDIMNLFPDNKICMVPEDIALWLNTLSLNPSQEDIDVLADLKHAFDATHSRYTPIFKDWYENNDYGKPNVSVIMPVYNVEAFLPECLDSIINQTLKNIEIICVDDGSSDNSVEILNEYAKKDKRIKVLLQKNRGAAIARNEGLKIAKGEYVSILDSDDFFELDFLERMFNQCKRLDLDVCVCNLWYYDNITKKDSFKKWVLKTDYLPQKEIFTYKDFPDYIFNFTNNWAWNKLFRRKFLIDNNLEFQDVAHTNDTFFTSMAILLAKSINVLNKNFIHYRVNNPKSLTSQNIRQKYPYEIIKVVDAMYHTIQENNCWNDVKQSFLNLIIDQYVFNISKIEGEECKELIKLIEKQLEKMNFHNISVTNFYEPVLWKRYCQSLGHNNHIPVILSSDDNYAPYMYVTMYSMLANANKDTYYDFYLMVPSAFSQENTNIIEKLQNIFNCEIHFIDMKNSFSDLKMQISHITSPTYYRLLAGDLLPQKYNKCIYLDVDICVCEDLAGLYNIDLKDNYIAGVVAAGYYFNEEVHKKRLALPDMRQYVNAGVLIMNLKKIREDNMTQKFLMLSKRNYASQDQDVVNVACYGHILLLPPKFNMMSKRLAEKNLKLLDIFKESDIEEAKTSPVIIHYADKNKPWNDITTYKCEWWWTYAIKSNYPKFRILKVAPSLLQKWFKQKTGEYFNINNPRTFNEKIQWLKLYDSTPIKTRLADKYLVRDWVKEKIGEQYLIPLLGVYDKFEEIDFDKLPNQFVIKCNHGSGYNIIIKDKSSINLQDIKEKLDRWCKINFAFCASFELHYMRMTPKIIIEQYMDDGTGDLRDYKYTCFNGKPEFIWIDSDRHTEHKRNLYDLSWKQLPYKVNSHYDTFPSPEKPACLEEMNRLASILSKGFAYVRVDFYIINDKIYFGEMTFTSSSGTEDIQPNSFANNLTKKLILPKQTYNIDTGEYEDKKDVSKFVTYLTFPYNIIAYYLKKKQFIRAQSLNFIKEITNYCIEVKNNGQPDNDVKILSNDIKVIRPAWFTNNSGIGYLCSGNNLKQKIIIKPIKDGKLVLGFRGSEYKFNGQRIPVWIDYKSIRINGKEILSEPVATWHDKHYRYELPVDNMQDVVLEVEQQYHQYTQSELKSMLLKLNPKATYLIDDIVLKIMQICKMDPEIIKQQVLSSLKNDLMTHDIEIKNNGKKDNNIIIKTKQMKVINAPWATNDFGVAYVCRGNKIKNQIIIKAIKDGKLVLKFRGSEYKFNGQRIPVWIDYKSIRINGKEILSEPVATWHDKAFIYEMPVDDGQEIILEIEQQYHQYNENELQNIILQLNPQSEYIANHLSTIIEGLKKIFPLEDADIYHEKLLNKTCCEIISALTSYRIDIKNLGIESNNVVLTATKGKIEQPKWLTNKQGIGKEINGDALIDIVNLKAIGDGYLRIDFRGPDRRFESQRFPIWIDYKSIKIDGKEILPFPVFTWHDEPYRCELPIKDGQKITLEIEQQYHQYTEEDLANTLLKLYPRSIFIKENIHEICTKILQKTQIFISESEKQALSERMFDIKKIKILTQQETIEKIKKEKISIARYGDGEIKRMFNPKFSEKFQKGNIEQTNRLKEIFVQKEKNLLICIDPHWQNGSELSEYYKHIVQATKYNIANLCKFNTILGNAGISRNANNVPLLKEIWRDKDVIIVEGELSRIGVGNDLFDNVKSLHRILCPAENAFNKYDEILEECKQQTKDKLFLIALGPTATLLAYDLAKLGYWALDIGHIDIVYEWKLRGENKKIKIPGKYVNEVTDGNIVEDCTDNDYLSSIITKVI